jgi:hypothetical protein
MSLAFSYLRPEQIVCLWPFEHRSVLGDPIPVDQEPQSRLQNPEQLAPHKGKRLQCIQ